jgi:hypothetical protein
LRIDATAQTAGEGRPTGRHREHWPYDFFVNQNPGALPSVEHEEVLAVIVDVKKEALSVER